MHFYGLSGFLAVASGNGKTGKPGQNDRAVKAGVLGLEPRLSDPESLVLPLHHTPVFSKYSLGGLLYHIFSPNA